ncbi:aldehyde dehydrogenase family protein [Mesorhizobium argentiipisi]|uniref:aldehyde dehydrogenase family protein n=1 Tax=Mesorhizobium argentiipisi TaxID=3015175 RepID=UPI0039F56C5F
MSRSRPRWPRPHALFQSGWSKSDKGARLAIFDGLAKLIAANRDALARTMAEEMGKPLFQGQMEADLCAEIASCASRHRRCLHSCICRRHAECADGRPDESANSSRSPRVARRLEGLCQQKQLATAPKP